MIDNKDSFDTSINGILNCSRQMLDKHLVPLMYLYSILAGVNFLGVIIVTMIEALYFEPTLQEYVKLSQGFELPLLGLIVLHLGFPFAVAIINGTIITASFVGIRKIYQDQIQSTSLSGMTKLMGPHIFYSFLIVLVVYLLVGLGLVAFILPGFVAGYFLLSAPYRFVCTKDTLTDAISHSCRWGIDYPIPIFTLFVTLMAGGFGFKGFYNLFGQGLTSATEAVAQIKLKYPHKGTQDL